MTYRPDIDGLRAIAVLAVVIFHLGVPGFAGGYIGVDVFFVISGYLITSIIERQYAAGRFSFADFYARRVRRLLPPLIATVLASTAQASGLPLYRRPVATILASLMLVALLPLSAWLGDGWSWREPDVVLAAEAVEAGKQRRYTHIRAACPINELDTHPACDRQKPLQVLVIGNSHEPDGFNFIHAGYGGDEVNLIRFGTTNTCPDLAPEGVAVTDDCKGRMAALLSADVMASLDVVVYAANKPFHANKAPFIDILSKLRARNPALRVITIGGYIKTRTDCWRLTNAARSTAACRDPANVTYFAVTPETQPLYRDLMALTDHFVDRIDLLCRDRQLQTCAIQAEDGTPAFLDRHHLSLEFASMAGRLYAARYPDLLESR